jgi:hypothetical protein
MPIAVRCSVQKTDVARYYYMARTRHFVLPSENVKTTDSFLLYGKQTDDEENGYGKIDNNAKDEEREREKRWKRRKTRR